MWSKWFYTIFSCIIFVDTYLWHDSIEKNRKISIIEYIEREDIEILFFASDIKWCDHSFEGFRFFTPCFECYSEELHTKSIWKFRILQFFFRKRSWASLLHVSAAAGPRNESLTCIFEHEERRTKALKKSNLLKTIWILSAIFKNNLIKFMI